MNPDVLAKILDELGQRFGPAGQHVFELAVRQVYVEAFIGGTIGLTLVVIGLVSAVWLSRRGGYDKGIDMAASFAVAVFGGLVLLLFVTPVLNPEYAAIRDILSALPRAK